MEQKIQEMLKLLEDHYYDMILDPSTVPHELVVRLSSLISDIRIVESKLEFITEILKTK